QDPVEAGHLSVDAPPSERRVARRAGRRRHGERHLALPDDEEHLARLVDLDVVAAVARTRNARGREPAPQRDVDAPGAWQAEDLLERVDGLEVFQAEVAVALDRVAQIAESPLEHPDAPAAGAERERGLHDVHVPLGGHGSPAGGGARPGDDAHAPRRRGGDALRSGDSPRVRRPERRDDAPPTVGVPTVATVSRGTTVMRTGEAATPPAAATSGRGSTTLTRSRPSTNGLPPSVTGSAGTTVARSVTTWP